MEQAAADGGSSPSRWQTLKAKLSFRCTFWFLELFHLLFDVLFYTINIWFDMNSHFEHSISYSTQDIKARKSTKIKEAGQQCTRPNAILIYLSYTRWSMKQQAPMKCMTMHCISIHVFVLDGFHTTYSFFQNRNAFDLFICHVIFAQDPTVVVQCWEKRVPCLSNVPVQFRQST